MSSQSKARAKAAARWSSISHKQCSKCKEVLPLTCFYVRGERGYFAPYSQCKNCFSRKGSHDTKQNKVRRYATDPKKYWAKLALLRAKRRAVQAGLEFSITLDDVVPLCVDNCPILGGPLTYMCGAGTMNHKSSPSIDRVDTTYGYTPKNIVVVSMRANQLKGNATLDELKKIVAFYVHRKHLHPREAA